MKNPNPNREPHLQALFDNGDGGFFLAQFFPSNILTILKV
jgi:hypothetical protein